MARVTGSYWTNTAAQRCPVTLWMGASCPQRINLYRRRPVFLTLSPQQGGLHTRLHSSPAGEDDRPALGQSVRWNLASFYTWVSSVTQSCPTLCNPVDCSTPGLPVHHQFPELAQTHVHRVGDAIQPSHPLLSPSLPAFNLSQLQGLFQGVSSLHQVAKLLELQHQSFQWTSKDFQGLIQHCLYRRCYKRLKHHTCFSQWSKLYHVLLFLNLVSRGAATYLFT